MLIPAWLTTFLFWFAAVWTPATVGYLIVGFIFALIKVQSDPPEREEGDKESEPISSTYWLRVIGLSSSWLPFVLINRRNRREMRRIERSAEEASQRLVSEIHEAIRSVLTSDTPRPMLCACCDEEFEITTIGDSVVCPHCSTRYYPSNGNYSNEIYGSLVCNCKECKQKRSEDGDGRQH